MGIRAKNYPSDFIKQAVEMCAASGKPIAICARDIGVAYETLYDWMKRAGKTRKQSLAPPPKPPKQTSAAMQAEIERLRNELEETRKQLEFAKKAAAFFALQNK